MRLFACLAALSLFLSGCSFDGTKKAEAKVTEFHQLLDTGKFDTILASSHETLKKDGPALMNILQGVNGTLGPVKASERQGWNIRTDAATGTVVELSYLTTFANGKAVETFVFYGDGDEMKLAGYNISSKAAEDQESEKTI